MSELPQMKLTISPEIHAHASEELQFEPFMMGGAHCLPSDQLYFAAHVIDGQTVGAILLLGRGRVALTCHLGADTCRELADSFVAMANRIEASAAERAAAALDRGREAGHGS